MAEDSKPEVKEKPEVKQELEAKTKASESTVKQSAGKAPAKEAGKNKPDASKAAEKKAGETKDKSEVSKEPSKKPVESHDDVQPSEKTAEFAFTSRLFHKYDFSEVHVHDVSLQNYVGLDSVVIPHTHGRYTGDKQFRKAKLNIVERLVNKVMRSGQGKRKLKGKYIRGRNNTGKKLKAILIVESAFDMIYAKTKINPIQVYVDAIENAGPREDITVVRFGGISRQQSVDVAPLRRVDEAIKNIALAGFSESFKSKTTASEALANEIIRVSKNDPQSFSISRKNALERMARSAR
ncbi:MAG: 30S ribosomal protein S7 [Candidatus Diapherotrites archaeon]|nr:30S ribosomal protein S7 [Candidatus Diapherotrites archaeon]